MNFLESTKNKAAKIFKKLLDKNKLPLSFLENSLFQRWAIAVILCLILAIILAPEIRLSAPEFKQGMIAPKNIKADHSFLVEDQQATEQKKNDTGDTNPAFFQVQKNEMIVREGEKIGYLELAKLNAFFKSAEDNKFSRFTILLGFFFTSLFLSIALYLWRTRNWIKASARSNIDLFVFGIIALLQILFIKAGIFISLAVNRAFPVYINRCLLFCHTLCAGSNDYRHID